MPHVVVEEAGDLQKLYQAFTPMVHRTDNEILKVQEFYLSRSGKDALLESVAIEQGAACTFFVQLKLHEKAITVRLLPATDPEKTPRSRSSWPSSRDSFEKCIQGVAMEKPIFKNT